jgi:hypothetical protein
VRLLAEGENLGEDLFVKPTDLLPDQEGPESAVPSAPGEAVVVSLADMASSAESVERVSPDEDVESWF